VKNARDILTTILKLAVAGGLIWWLVHRGSLNFGLLADLAKQPTFLFSAITASFINICLNNYRWGILLRGQGFAVGMRETLPLTLIGLFFNYAMPGGVGGDLVKGFYLMQDHPERRTAAATSVLIDRVLGVAGMVVMSLAAVAFNLDAVRARPQLTSLAFVLATLFLGFGVFFALAFSRRIRKHDVVNRFLSRIPGGRAIRLVYDAVHSYRHAMPSFWAACAITLISQSFALIFFILIGTAMGFADVPVKAYVFAVPLGLIATALPISPAGVGVGQVAFSYLFDWSTGVRSAIGSNLITAHQLVTFLLSLSGGVFYFRRRKPVLKTPQNVS
jgi:uncharacterized protein (TIRG00374 family)